jgi:thioredoxin-related protein
MKRTLALLVAALSLIAAACGQRDDFWFDGDYSAATTLAKQNGSLVMLVFETDWCIWCDRMEREVFTHPDVRGALQGLVALKLDAEGDGERLAARYGVDSYPTIVFINGDGEEVDRILGYLPPGEFVTQSRRIRGGGTEQAGLRRRSASPADAQAVRGAVAKSPGRTSA